MNPASWPGSLLLKLIDVFRNEDKAFYTYSSDS